LNAATHRIVSFEYSGFFSFMYSASSDYKFNFMFGLEIWLSLAGRFGSLWPRDLALFGREIWLSPVSQATWEARAVGWFEV
jgi:hypothetical protein